MWNGLRKLVVLFICLIAPALVSCGDSREDAARSDGSSSTTETAPSGALPELSFVRIPAGSFDMGSDANETADQSPVHRVAISRAFELQSTEVTQAQWRAVMGSDPSHFQGDDLPVEQVSWKDAQTFIRRLNELDPGRGYRLPTEAEWEYACRAGSTEQRFENLDEVAWWHRNSENQTHPVGQKQPNAWGLYDMIGNVWELCADWKDSYPSAPVTDPTGPTHGYYKVSRGGSWFDVARAANSTFRSSPAPDDRGDSLGLRLARSVEN